MTDETSYGTVEKRLDACDCALVHLTAQLADLRNEMSLLTSLQRTCMDLDTRVTALEKQPEVFGFAPAIPASAPKHAPFGSIEKLVETVEHMFDCQDGDHRAWHTVWVGGAKEEGYREYPYTVLGVIADSHLPDPQERLRQALYTALYKLKQTCKSDRPVLYWRHAKEIRIQEEQECGGLARYKIRVRLAIPEADFSAVSEWVKTDDTGYAVLRD